MLTYPDPNKPYILYTDASDECIGACLTQIYDNVDGKLSTTPCEKPRHYLSHKLTKSPINWPVIEKEAFAIFYALQKLDQYLHDSEFVIRTDHKPLKNFMNSTIENKKIQYWTTNIRGYNCKIEYIEGKKNVCADMLSHLTHTGIDYNDSTLSGPDITDKTFEINFINSSTIDPKNFAQYEEIAHDKHCSKEELTVPSFDITIEQCKDKELMKIKETLQNGQASQAIKSKYIILHNVLYYLSKADTDPVKRLYIPEQLKQSVILEYHDYNGHLGIDKTYDAIKGKYYWPCMCKELYKYVNSCVICQSRNLKKVKPPLE